MHKYTHRGLLLLLTLCLSGCHVPSKTALGGDGGRNAYNETLQKTVNEQMLLNLVRLKYLDFPYFLDVGSITTQFTYGTKIAPLIPIPGFNQKNPFQLGGEFNWQNQPTISYNPLEGHSFSKHLIKPIDLVVIQQLVYQGWNVDRVFRLMVQSLDELYNAPSASGPSPDIAPRFEKFAEMTKLLRYFQQKEELQVGVQLNPQRQADDGSSVPFATALQISFPSEGEEAQRLKGYLKGVEKEGNHYILNAELGFNQEAEIGIMPRSLIGCLYYLSHGVEAPTCEGKKRRFAMTYDIEGEPFDWKKVIGDLITIKNSCREPCDTYVKVKYKGHWYYIEDTDIPSKRTFFLLMQIYGLQSGSEPRQIGPLLTIPIGVS